MEKFQPLTEEMFMKGTVNFIGPKALSFRNEDYEKYALRFTKSDVETLCGILQHPTEVIFKEGNLPEIMHYGELQLDGERYYIGSSNVKDVLLEIRRGTWRKNDVLHDVSQLLTKHDPKELALKVKVYNHLIREGYATLGIG